MLLFGLASTAWLADRPSHAADSSSIGVTAVIFAEACEITAGSNLEIDFGTMSSVEFQDGGAVSTWINAPEKIKLSCPSGTRTVSARFEGTADSVATDTFKNDGTARNVSIELQLQSGTKIAPGASHNVTVTSGKAEYALRARLYSKYGGVKWGTVSSVASFILSYQ